MPTTVPIENVAAQNLRAAAYNRLSKAILRRRTVDQLVRAIENDIANLAKEAVLRVRSQKVLDYMAGYRKAVDDELAEANDAYDLEAYKSVRKVRMQEKRKADAS